ncbi:MAG: S9 family peptidase [Fimbriimonadaceae bacterium]|nr:S9 family peptidase [Fimbriimonadaceae bacterium]
MRRTLTGTLALVLAAALCGQAPRKPLTPEEYGRWETLGPAQLSPDGRWMTAQIGVVEGDGRLIVRSCDGPERVEIPVAGGARFSDDSKWVAYTIGPKREDAKRLQREKKAVRLRLGLRNLASGAETVYEDVQGWSFLKDGGTLMVHHYPVEGQPKGGSDLEIVSLGDMNTLSVGNVARFLPYRQGRFVALLVESPAGRNSVQVYDAATGSIRQVHGGKDTYRALAWADKAPVFAFMIGTKVEKMAGDRNGVAVVRDLDAAKPTVVTVDPETIAGFPKGQRILDAAGLLLSDGGDSLVFGVKEWEASPEKPKAPEEPKTNVEIWHTRDVVVMPLQKNQASAERNRHGKAVYRLRDNSFRVFAEPELDAVLVSSDHRWAYARDPRKYESAIKVGGLEYADVLAINLADGARSSVLEKTISNVGGLGAGTLSPSDDGQFALFFEKGDWFAYDAAKGERRNLTRGTGVSFGNLDDDHTIPEKPAASAPRWMQDNINVLLHTDYDAYLANAASGSVARLTEGAKEKRAYRYVDIGFDEDGPRAQDPLYFQVLDERTKAAGIAVYEKGGTRMLTSDDATLQLGQKSKGTDRVLFRRGTYGSSPNAFLTNLAFDQAKPLTNTNPWQKEYTWGKSELLQYKAEGKELQATLVYPADYQEGRTYPMIVSIYERLSDGLHAYQTPSNTNPYNVQHYSQAGYFVLMPDIAYRDRNPGLSAVACLETAVKTAVYHNRYIDGKRVGLTGHSWGGYQTVFVAMKSKAFACFVAGAPLTELLTMYNGYYWNWGQSNQVIFESSQGRMGVPWWEDWKSYYDNSPLFHAKDMAGPMLVEAGTADGAVDWHQSQVLYNTLRRMGKEMVLLVYEGENHGLAREENQKDYAARARHFFDVHLKGAKPEPWVTQGVPFIKQREGGS